MLHPHIICCRIVELLFERGVDYSLTDVEGNTAKDLAVKNGQVKAAKAISSLIKQRAERGRTGGTAVAVSCFLFSTNSTLLYFSFPFVTTHTPVEWWSVKVTGSSENQAFPGGDD